MRRRSEATVLLAFSLIGSGCDPSAGPAVDDDPHVRPNGHNYEENRSLISPPTVLHPLYVCASNVAVKHFLKGARIDVFIAGNPTPIGTAIGEFPTIGVNIDVGAAFAGGEVITATQTINGFTSGPSNAVTVTSHSEDYPGGLPEPRINAPPLWECGLATGVRDVVPGATVEVFAENPDGAGGFDPLVSIGTFKATPEWGLNWTPISAQYERGAHITAATQLCTDTNTTPSETVQPEPTLESATVHDVQEGNDRVVARGPAPDNGPLMTGARVRVFEAGTETGSTVTPGGGGHIIGVNPDVTNKPYTATQTLCTQGPASTPVDPTTCEDLPAPKIKPPLPGDTQLTATEYVEGAEILVFADGIEIGHSGAPVINLTAPVGDGQNLIIVQRVGSCESQWVYVIDVECENLGGDDKACSGEWPAFRHNGLRSANQTVASDLSDPYKVKTLKPGWSSPFTPPGGRAFRGSPVVHNGMVYIGNGNGRFYALDAATGAVQWQYPPAGSAALVSQFESNPSSCGIAASAAIARIQNEVDAVIFSAPDPSIGSGLGSSRLFALNAQTGAEIWKSPEIAVLDGLDRGNTSQLHEQTGYSSPLILGNRIYIGIANHGDNPIQNGRVAAVNLNDGSLVGSFSFKATGTRGGGVWSSVAGGLSRDGIFITTGNARVWNGGSQSEPTPNHSLSMLRLSASSGNVDWKLQPVPFVLDDDPDWAAGPSLMRTPCGDLVVSTMKDGWSYAVEAGSTYSPDWQFPPTASPPDFKFDPAWGTSHGDTRYLVPGAAWDSVYLTQTGGEDIVNTTGTGFGRLHALNACGGARVRWIADVPSATLGDNYQMGPPTVSRGIVFVGTAAGHVVALADPSVWPSTSSICRNPAVSVADCAANGFQIVPRPHVLLDIDVSNQPIMGEPVLADGRMFVASGFSCTGGGSLVMLEPRP